MIRLAGMLEQVANGLLVERLAIELNIIDLPSQSLWELPEVRWETADKGMSGTFHIDQG